MVLELIAHSVYAPLSQLSVPHEGYLCGSATRSPWYVVAGGAMSHSKGIGPGPFHITHAARQLRLQLEGALYTLPELLQSSMMVHLLRMTTRHQQSTLAQTEVITTFSAIASRSSSVMVKGLPPYPTGGCASAVALTHVTACDHSLDFQNYSCQNYVFLLLYLSW